MLTVHVVDHPLVAHKLTLLRDERTPTPTFRALAHELATLLAYEATRDVATERVDLTTPMGPTTGRRLAAPQPLVVPILRAGLGMLDAFLELLPTADVGFLGLVRDETTYEASTYAERLPADLSGRHCVIVDPMLATGGTLTAAVEFLRARRAARITAVCLLAAPEGVEAVRRCAWQIDTPVTLVTAAVDDGLDERAYIVPGLGDAGDRMYGAAE